MMNSYQEFANVNFCEVVSNLQQVTEAYQKLWKCIIGYAPCIACFTLHLHSGAAGVGASNLIRLLHSPLSQQHLHRVGPIQEEVQAVIQNALEKDPSFFKCKHVEGQNSPQKYTKGCN